MLDPRKSFAVLMTAALALRPAGAASQEPGARALSLDEAIALALENSHGLEVARQRVVAKRSSTRSAFTNYFPRLKTDVSYSWNDNSQGIVLPRGSLGEIPDLGPIPDVDRTVTQGGNSILLAVTTLQQPLTQFRKIGLAHGLAEADYDSAQAGAAAARQAVVIGAIRGYYGLLLAQRREEVAKKRLQAAQARTGTRTEAVTSGLALDPAAAEARVGLLQARQAVMDATDERADVRYRLGDLLGLPDDGPLELSLPEAEGPSVGSDSLDVYVSQALSKNADVLIAGALVDKASRGVSLARADYIPDVALVGVHIYQNSFPFLPRNTFGVGVRASWTIFDFGQRGNQIRERGAQLAQARANLERVRGEVRGDVEKAYRDLQRAGAQVRTAQEVVELRTELARLRDLQAEAGTTLEEDRLDAEADRMEAEVQLFAARLAYLLAGLELQRLTGEPLSPSD